jgi:SAM-dependent methyltransferase
MSGYEFDSVASEYYDSVLHPTCRNLRDGSLKAIRALLEENLKVERYLEIGAGRSVLQDLPCLREIVDDVVINDESQRMLQYSEALATKAHLVCGDFTTIKFDREGFELVVASLGDAYNDERSWTSIAEVLSLNGRCIFTTPSYPWSRAYRSTHQGGRYDVARFKLRSGEVVDLESHILPELEQAKLVQSVGLRVRLTAGVYKSDLVAPISPKLDVDESSLIPLLIGYLVTK